MAKFEKSKVETKTKAKKTGGTTPHPLRKTGQAVRDKEQRRSESDARNEAWRKLTPNQQLYVLDMRGQVAKKQRAKILFRMTVATVSPTFAKLPETLVNPKKILSDIREFNNG